MTVRSYSTTPAANNAAPPNGAPEGMLPSAVNNTLRQVMADVRGTFEDLPFFDYGHTPTRIDNDTFTVSTDLTALYAAGRRLKLVGASTGYAAVASSSYSAPDTTVNVTMDSGNVPTSLTTISIAPDQTNSLSQSAVGTALYPRTAAEISVGATIVNPFYPPLNVMRYGADSTGVASSVSAFNAAYNVAMAMTPHGAIYAPAGKYSIPSPGLTWTNQNDIRLYGDGPNLTQLISSGSNYTVLTVSADTGAGTTGTNLELSGFGIGPFSTTGVSALKVADYFGFKLDNLQLYSSGDSLTMAGMAVGVCNNLNCLTAGTNAAGNSSLKLTTDTLGIANGPIVFNGGNFNGQSNVTVGGAVWSQKSFAIVFNSPLITAFGATLTSVFAATNLDDITIVEGYSESARNTTADTAVLFDLGVTAAVQNFKLLGGFYFTGAGGHKINYGINAHAIQALSVENVNFVSLATAGIIYTLGLSSLVEISNTVSSGAGNPPVLDASTGGPASGYLKSWTAPWPFLDTYLATTVANVTGDGTAYTVLFDTTRFDDTSMYSSGTGIATVPTQTGGRYEVSVSVMVNGVTGTGWTNMEVDIIQKTSGGATVTVHPLVLNPGAVRNPANQAIVNGNCILKCTGGDQISVLLAVSGSTKTIGVVGASTEYTRLSVRYLG